MMRPCDHHDCACLCSKAGFPGAPCEPDNTIPTSRVLRWSTGLAVAIAFAWFLVYVYSELPPCFTTGSGSCT
jgi:hypothetical protein